MAAVSCQKNLSLQAPCKMWLKVWFKPSSNMFSGTALHLNAESNLLFSSAKYLNHGLNFSSVLKSSCSNLGSGLNFGNTSS